MKSNLADIPTTDDREREQLLRMLASVTLLIFFQAYMVAPIIPELATAFDAPVRTVALIVPACLIPYGLATLVYGLFGRSLRYSTGDLHLAHRIHGARLPDRDSDIH